MTCPVATSSLSLVRATCESSWSMHLRTNVTDDLHGRFTSHAVTSYVTIRVDFPRRSAFVRVGCRAAAGRVVGRCCLPRTLDIVYTCHREWDWDVGRHAGQRTRAFVDTCRVGADRVVFRRVVSLMSDVVCKHRHDFVRGEWVTWGMTAPLREKLHIFK